MNSTTLSFSNLHTHGRLFSDILKARGADGTAPSTWDLPPSLETGGYDQYDTPVSRWIAVDDGAGQVLAGARLTPTTAQAGVYSYMIRDAQAGLIDQVPTDLLAGPAPVDPAIWEMTRGFVAAGASGEVRDRANRQLIAQILRTAREEGIAQLICILPCPWSDWAARRGLTGAPMGQVIDLDGRPHQAVLLDVDLQLH